VANNTQDDVAQLKQELAQFLLTEITSVQGAATFKQEVADQVGAVIDQLFAERLTPALARMEQESARQIREITDRVEPALRRLEDGAPGGPAVEQHLAEIAKQLDDVRQRLARVESRGGKPGGAMVEPIRAPVDAGRASGVAPVAASASFPRWALWLLLLLILLTAAGLGNLYLERLVAPAPEAARPTPPPTASAASAAPSPVVHAAAPAPQAVAPPPTATPSVVTPAVTPQPPPTPQPAPRPQASRIPADFAIERGWLAAQPFAVEPRLARHVGVNGSFPTLRSVVCGASEVCTSDALLNSASDAKQVIVLQMLMAQIGDRYCAPRRTVAVTGQVSAAGLVDLAAIAACAGGTAHPCVETQNRVCPPDADSLQAGMATARAALLRWALWRTGST